MAITPKDVLQITLPSNSNIKRYPDNNPSSFIVEFPAPVRLEGDWEVAIIDIRYPQFHNNIPYDIPVVFVIDPPSTNFFTDNPLEDYPLEETSKESSKWGVAAKYVKDIMKSDEHKIFSNGAKYRIVYINPGHSKGVTQAADIFEYLFYQAFKDWSPLSGKDRFTEGDEIGFHFKTDKQNSHYMFNITGMKVSILTVPELLGGALNFDYKNFKQTLRNNPLVWFQHKTLTTPTYPMSEHFSLISSMYVYSDLTDYQIVGEALVPTLGIVPIQAGEKSLPYWSFNPPFYFTVKKKEFKTIEIQLNTESGLRFPFIGNGHTEARLHFQKKRKQV